MFLPTQSATVANIMRMKVICVAGLVWFSLQAGGCFGASTATAAASNRDRSFDANWRFLRADAAGAEAPGFDDSHWRTLDVPHDWSIEDLPPKTNTVPELEAVTGPWRFEKGDDAAWKARDFNDSGWQKVELPDTWEHHSNYTNDNVYGWFRRRIEIPAECKGKDFDLLLGCIDDVDETFLNGRRIGGTGTFPPDFQTAWDKQRRYRVPPSLVRGDGSDVVAVRVFDGSGNGGIYAAGIKSVRTGPFDSGQSEGGASTWSAAPAGIANISRSRRRTMASAWPCALTAFT
jgi:beta-galactosidase